MQALSAHKVNIQGTDGNSYQLKKENLKTTMRLQIRTLSISIELNAQTNKMCDYLKHMTAVIQFVDYEHLLGC